MAFHFHVNVSLCIYTRPVSSTCHNTKVIAHIASAMRLEEHRLLEKLQFLQVRDNQTKGCPAPAKDVTADSSLHQDSVLPDFLPLDDMMSLPMIYSNCWISDRQGFPHSPQFKTRIPDVAVDTLLAESFCKGNDALLNPTFGFLNSEGFVNGYNNKLHYGFPVINGRFSRSSEPFGCDDNFIMQGKGLFSKTSYENSLGDRRRMEISNAHIGMFQRFQRFRSSASLFHKKDTIYIIWLRINMDAVSYKKNLRKGRPKQSSLYLMG